MTEEQEELGLDLSQHGESALGADLLGHARSNGAPHPENVAVGSS